MKSSVWDSITDTSSGNAHYAGAASDALGIDEHGLMRTCHASIDDLPRASTDRLFTGTEALARLVVTDSPSSVSKPSMMEVLHLLEPGRLPYTEGLRLMRELVASRQTNAIGDTLLLLEHPPVLTLGRNATRANILATEHELARRGVEIHEINRGGDITYHGPGQLVGYPIFDLRGDLPGKRGPHLGPVDFVRLMEEALILTCKDFGVPAQRICKRTGVWTYAGGAIPEKKIAAIGIHVARAVTSHGFALNVTTDLRDFNWIIPCGIADRGVTSLELESPQIPAPTLTDATNAIARNFGRVFHRQILAADSLADLMNAGAPLTTLPSSPVAVQPAAEPRSTNTTPHVVP